MTRKEALKIVRENYPHFGTTEPWLDLEKALATLIPELRESEDERILVRLIEYFQGFLEGYEDCYKDGGCVKWEGLDVKSILAYLEKQKEQKPVQSEEEKEYVRTLKGLVSDFIRDSGGGITDIEYYQNIYDWLDGRHIEQKPAEWSEDWREEDIQTRFAFYTYKDDSSVLYLSNVFVEETSRNHGFGTRILRAAEKVAETIGATTISLKVKQDSPANAWYRKNGYGYVAFEDGYDWLEKNLEYMKPNKQEWSEEDEIYLQDALWCVEKAEKSCKDEEDKGACWSAKRWLKSLRPSWKPSENQMSMLLAVVNDPNNAGSASCHLSLESLYNDLNKL